MTCRYIAKSFQIRISREVKQVEKKEKRRKVRKSRRRRRTEGGETLYVMSCSVCF